MYDILRLRNKIQHAVVPSNGGTGATKVETGDETSQNYRRRESTAAACSLEHRFTAVSLGSHGSVWKAGVLVNGGTGSEDNLTHESAGWGDTREQVYVN